MFDAIDRLIGRLPVRLSLVTVAGRTAFAPLSGSSIASPPGTSLADIHRAALPFMGCALLLVGLLILEPRLAPLLRALAATDQPADFCPCTAKKDAILGCSGSSTRPSIRRAWRIFCPRTISPSFGFAIGLRASGTASAAV